MEYQRQRQMHLHWNTITPFTVFSSKWIAAKIQIVQRVTV